MKRLVTLIIVSIFLFGFTGCSSKEDAFSKVSYTQYQNMLQKKQNFILYVGSKNCSHCQEFKPILNTVIREYDLDVIYLDTSELSEEEATEFFSKTSVTGTPTILFIKDGNVELFSRIVGVQTEEKLVEKFKTLGYIK